MGLLGPLRRKVHFRRDWIEVEMTVVGLGPTTVVGITDNVVEGMI